MTGIYFTGGVFVAAFGAIVAVGGSPFTLIGPVAYSGSGLSMLPVLFAYPFLLALIGAITGFVVAWLYNFVARFTRGVLVEFREAGRFET